MIEERLSHKPLLGSDSEGLRGRCVRGESSLSVLFMSRVSP
jgi:hypothetical protein